MASAGPVPALAERAARCADRLRDADEVLLASHIDADSLTSAALRKPFRRCLRRPAKAESRDSRHN